MDWKTEQEWIIIRYFREYFPDFPKGRLRKSESPDFKLWTSPRRFIGIELTQIRPVSNPDPVPGFLDFRFAIDQLRSTIQAKEEKIGIYLKQKPDFLWLIIFADYSEANAIDRILSLIGRESLSSGFDRIFLFDVDQHKTFLLK
ncbi:MAG: hypothetical protein V2A67_02005 [Bacteroidota bacterium]